ncbi:hypothetical protein V6N13_004936 [Hibiscus sabdariffa]|uniref:Uncharacterized protein n=1 Tax=Hibiscus sabdariffa TaxID=183260 RepID=A0ABR2RZZ4_9ROSI
MHDSAQICHGGKSPAIGRKICTILFKSAMAENLLPRSVGGKSPAHGVGGKICCPDRKSPACGVGGKLPARGVGGIACLVGFTNSAPADVIAALAGSECYQPGTTSVQLPIWQRSGQISVEALAPRARLWELILNDLNDGFVEVPGALWAGIWAGNMPRQELGRVLLRQEFLPVYSRYQEMMDRLNKCDSSKTCAYSRYYGQKDITHKRVDHTHDNLNHDLL